jgi:hypothetical protein
MRKRPISQNQIRLTLGDVLEAVAAGKTGTVRYVPLGRLII